MLDVMQVPKTISVLRKKRSLSSSSLIPIADGLDTAGPGATPESLASCMVEVETLESSFAELESLRTDIEAQTSMVRKPG